MVRATKKPKEKVLSITEVATIQDEKRELEHALEASERVGVGTQAEQIDKGQLKTQINRLDHYLHEMKPGRLTAQQKDALVKREKELEELIKEGIPTRYEMDHPAKCPGAVRKHLHWDARTKKMAVEYRNLQRLLRPGEERSIEQLRKDGKRGGG